MSRPQKDRKISAGWDWEGHYPFKTGKKRPKLIILDQTISTGFGAGKHQIPLRVYMSTDRIHCIHFVVPPNNYSEPPSSHGGDEVYYMLEGTATVLNPETGRVHIIREGDGFIIPKDTLHQIYNFTNKKITMICIIALKASANKKFTKKPIYYKAE